MTLTITKILYQNNDFFVALAKDADKQSYKISGKSSFIKQHHSYECILEKEVSPKYGLVYKAVKIEQIRTYSKAGLITYFSSSTFEGVGKITATNIVDALGTNAITKIIEDHNILTKAPILISKTKALYIKDVLMNDKTKQDIFVKLLGLGLTETMSQKIYEVYQDKTLSIIDENPYKLIDNIFGVSFIKADEIALKSGIESDSTLRVEACILYILMKITYEQGSTCVLKEQLFNEVNKYLNNNVILDISLQNLIEKRKIFQDKEFVFLKEVYDNEISVCAKINELQTNLKASFEYETLLLKLEKLELKNGWTYTKTQKQAIIMALLNKISIITGGPGTGKSTVIKAIVELYCNVMNYEYDINFLNDHVGLVAPTGRASKRMQEILGLNSKTIHSALGYNVFNDFTYNKNNPLVYKLIIVDEASMVDINLAGALFSAIKNDAIVIIVGDSDQLPSVGPGLVLQDLIDSNVINLTKLIEVHRQKNNSMILDLAYAINNNVLNSELLTGDNQTLFCYHKFRTEEQCLDLVQRFFKDCILKNEDIINDIQVLVPMHDGLCGTRNLNTILQELYIIDKSQKLSVKENIFYIGDKVIQEKNDPQRGIVNGDCGVVVDLNKDENELMIKFDNRIIKAKDEQLLQLSLGYAMTVHKSQGSEYKKVFFPIAKAHQFMLRKQLIYTAITRTKERLYLCGDFNLLVNAANKFIPRRKTLLAKHLQDEII